MLNGRSSKPATETSSGIRNPESPQRRTRAQRNPVVWTLLDESVLRRRVGGPQVMAEQLHKVADMAEAGRLRLHVLPCGVGAHASMESLRTLMSFEDSAPVATSMASSPAT